MTHCRADKQCGSCIATFLGSLPLLSPPSCLLSFTPNAAILRGWHNVANPNSGGAATRLAPKTMPRSSDETATLSRRPTLAMTDIGPVSTFYPGRRRDESPSPASRQVRWSLDSADPPVRIPVRPRPRALRRRSTSPSSASAVSLGRFRLRLIPKSTDPTLLMESDDDDFLPHVRPESRAQSPDHSSVSSSTGTVLPWNPPNDATPLPPPQPPQRPETPSPSTSSPPPTPARSSTPSFQTAPSQPLTPSTTPHTPKKAHPEGHRPPQPPLPLTPTSNKRKSTAPHTNDTSPSTRFRRTSPPPLYPTLPDVPLPSAIRLSSPTEQSPFLSLPRPTTPPQPQTHTLLSPPSFPSLIALWRGTPRNAEPPLPASGPPCPHCTGGSSLLRVGPRSANAGRPYYGCDRACRPGRRRFVVWADLIGVGEGGDVECYCGEPARWSRTWRWDEWWDCADMRCGFMRWGENLEGVGRGGRAYC
ncbi:hypothetical protein QBC39DRAFT_382424 [Podospora conica]|nr:hypothetical protein QBC39DRAFT_382424 [Schizothecium conicum]